MRLSHTVTRKMAEPDAQKVEAILQDYAETLEILTINSKPLINDLTMAADRYKQLAPQIVGKIESRLFEVPVNQKLPLLYLLDSIMKNLRRQYCDIVNTKIVAIFCHCFEKLTEPKVRISLYKLRQTWNPFIAKKRLAAIDKHIHALDPNWPVTATDIVAPTSPTIHVNPDFLVTGDRGGGKKPLSTPQQTDTRTRASNRISPTKDISASATTSSSSSSSSSSLEQRRKTVLELQKKKKEQLRAKNASRVDDSTNTTSTPPLRGDPRRVVVVTGSTNSSAGKKKSSLSPRRPLSSRSSLSPECESHTKRRKLSPRPRPRSVSPSPSLPPNSHPSPRAHLKHARTHPPSNPRHKEQDRGGEKKERKIGDILNNLDITSLMGSIQRVKEQTQGDNSSTGKGTTGHGTTGHGTTGHGSSASTAEKRDRIGAEDDSKKRDRIGAEDDSKKRDRIGAEDDSKKRDRIGAEDDSKMVKPPPEKKIKLEDNGSAVSTSTSLVSKEVGVADTVEDDDVIPKIKSSHLNLDDIPMELLPTHQEKIMKQVERQLKSGRLSEEQHSVLVKQLDQLYALQRKKENGRESRGDSVKPEESLIEPEVVVEGRKSSPPSPPLPPAAADDTRQRQTDHDSVKTLTTNHLHSPPSLSPPLSPPLVSVPTHVVSDSKFHPPSPPMHPSVPPHQHPPLDPHVDHRPPNPRGPHHQRSSFTRHPPRPFPPDHHTGLDHGTRPYRGREPRGNRPYNRPPRHLGHPNSEWNAPEENTAKNTLPPNQGNTGISDPTQLFSKLLEHGMIEKEGGGGEGNMTGPQEMKRPMPPPAATQIRFPIPKLAFTVATLKKPYSVLVKLMYLGDPCATCGLRFRDRKTADYSNHLDWHYKMNSRDKTTQRPRNWFLHPEDWLKFEESKTGEESRELLVLEREVVEASKEERGEGDTGQEEGQEVSCKMLPGEESEVCTICAEEFEKFWEEELEEWHFKEAVREEEKLYHTYCYQDAKESGTLDKSLQQAASPADIEHKPLA